MKITEQIYEEYALDYIEGTLSAEDRKAFEAFLNAHPAIASEIRALQTGVPVLEPDTSVRFDGKTSLRRRPALGVRLAWVGAVAAVLVLGVWIVAEFQHEPIGPALPENRLAGNRAAVVEPALKPLVVDTQALVLAKTVGPEEKKIASAAEQPVKRQTASVETSAAVINSRANIVAPAEVVLEVEVSTLTVSRTESPEILVESPWEAEDWAGESDFLAQEMSTFKPFMEEDSMDVEPVYTTEEVWVKEGREQQGGAISAARKYMAENSEQMGLLNILNQKGLKRLVIGILTPLAELAPLRVHETREERVVVFASIPISRKNKQQ